MTIEQHEGHRFAWARHRLAWAPWTWGFITDASGVGLLACSAWLITRASQRPAILTLSIAIAGVQAFALGRGIFRYIERLALHDAALDRLATLRLELFDRLESLVPGGLPCVDSGSLLSAFVTDCDAVVDGGVRRQMTTIDLLCSSVVGIVIVSLISWRLAFVLFVGVAATCALSRGVAEIARRSATRETAVRAELAQVVIGAVRSANELIAYGRQDLVSGAVGGAETRAFAASHRVAIATGTSRALFSMGSVSTIAVLLDLGIAKVGHHQISGILLSVATFVALAVLDAGSSLPDAAMSALRGDAAARRIESLATLRIPTVEPVRPTASPSRPSAVSLVEATVEADFGGNLEGGGQGDGRDSIDALTCVSEVGSGRPDSRSAPRRSARILDGASIIVRPGAVTALVGPSGSGKSSVLLTLLHFLECTSGQALLGATDIRKLRRRDLSDHLGWVPDVTHVFNGSLASNLRLANTSSTDAELVEALERAGLGTWFAQLPEGLDTSLGRAGLATSSGEEQRISLARALLTTSDTLLLDEPTAHLDPYGASVAIEQIIAAASGRSVLLVSHDPIARLHADHIVHIDHGRTQAQ